MANILFLYNLTDNAVEPWLEAGHNCISVDLQHPKTYVGTRNSQGVREWRVSRDVLEFATQCDTGVYDFILSFTPCTSLAVSGARWFKSKREANPRFQEEAVELARVVEQFDCPSITENPVSMLATLWQKPTGYVHPWWFTGWCEDDNYSKKTGLWCLNGACMPEKFVKEGLPAPDDRIHKAPPGPERANFRSATPKGMARALYEANKHLVEL